MAITTTKIQWRSPYSLSDLATKIKAHYATAGWTMVDDQSAGNPRYFVVTKDRGTGLSGDNPIVIVNVEPYWPGVYLRTCDSWDATAHTGTNVTQAQEGTIQIQNADCDLYISTDDGFTWMTALNGSSVLNTPLIGVATMERRAGDVDGGAMYGVWRSEYAHTLRVSSVKNGETTLATNLYYSVSTPIGGGYALAGVNDAGEDVMFSLVPFVSAYGKMKNQINGLRACTANKFANGADTGAAVIDGYKWMFINHNSSFCFAIPVASSITTV